MISSKEAKDAMKAFELCFKEAKKVKGIEDYEKYHLALELSKTLIRDNQRHDFVQWLLNDSTLFDSFGHELTLALKGIANSIDDQHIVGDIEVAFNGGLNVENDN